MFLFNLTFTGIPENYSKIDNFISRSAQPKKEDFQWLKSQGVTDVINFRTMKVSGLNYVEKDVVEKAGMNYHNIPTKSADPEKNSVLKFLDLIKSIAQNNGKVHIHCKAGADRTGMYSFIYKSIKGIGTNKENIAEWLARGHNPKRYPNMISWTEKLLKQIQK